MIKIGALTSKPYAFTARSWELKDIESIDLFDSMGSNIKYNLRGSNILRVLPKVNDLLNEEWISDKVRFNYDGLKFQRLLYFYKYYKQAYHKISWHKVFHDLYYQKHFEFSLLKKTQPISTIQFYLGEFIGFDFHRDLFHFSKDYQVSVVNTNLIQGNFLDFRKNYLLQGDIKDDILFVGCNARLESPILNLKIRRAIIQKQATAYNLGYYWNSTYPVKNIGSNFQLILSLLEGRSFSLKNPFILFGSSIYQRFDFYPLIDFLNRNQIRAHFLQPEAGAVNYYEYGYKNELLSADVNWLMGDDKTQFKNTNYKIYQGHHGDINYRTADLIIPIPAAIETNSKFYNNEGLLQETHFIQKQVDEFFPKTFSSAPSIIGSTEVVNVPQHHLYRLDCGNIYNVMEDYYRNDSISRSSAIMALTSSRLKRSNFKQ